MNSHTYSKPTLVSNNALIQLYCWDAQIGSSPSAKNLIVMCHGLTNNHNDAPLFAEMREALLKDGYSLALFDFYGSGNSDGYFHEKSLGVLRKNLSDVLDFLSTSRTDSQIAIFGRSVGGTICAFFLADPRIKAAVLASPPTKLTAAFMPLYSEPIGGFVHLPNRTKRSGQIKGDWKLPVSFFEELTPLTEDLQRIALSSCPTLMMQGGKDSKVDVENTKQYYDLLSGPKRWLFFPSGDHEYTGLERDTTNTSVEWFRNRLR